MSKTGLFATAGQWQWKEVSAILKRDNSLVHAMDPRGRTALHLCAGVKAEKLDLDELESVNTARVLLRFGADINATEKIDDQGEVFLARPVWYAIALGGNYPLAGFLLRRGADPSGCLWAAIWADNQRIVKALLSAKAPLEQRILGETPLVYAARLGRLGMATLLVKAGADPKATGPTGRSAVDYAEYRNHPEMMALFR